jgi:uncharacterized protein YqjF (DUF2071 family)
VTEPVPAEPVTPAAPRAVRAALLTMRWQHVAFLHWPLRPGLAAPLLPPGVRPDELAGTSYVGLVALRMGGVGPPGLPRLPYLSSFPQVNIRLYTVGPDGRRGVAFLSLDAARLLPAIAGRAGGRLPYRWSAIRIHRDGDQISYLARRRWPGPAAMLRLRIRVAERVTAPSALEHFLTARWGLHAAWYRRTAAYLPNEHPPWDLYHAHVLDLAGDLLPAAGLPLPATAPVSVLYSPGVLARFGLPGLARR